MPQTEYNKSKIRRSAYLWLPVLSAVLLVSTALLLRVIPHSFAAEVTMEVYQQSGHKVFGTETVLDVFDNPKLNNQPLVAPFTVGDYTFAVYNNSNSARLPYELEITGTNLDNIPLVFSLQKNGEYIFGGENDEDMLPLAEIGLPDLVLAGGETDLYTIKWRWNTENDEIDTAIGDKAAFEKDLIYSLLIKVTGTIDEAEIKSGGGGQSDTSVPKTVDNSSSGDELSGLETGDNSNSGDALSGISEPETGDSSSNEGELSGPETDDSSSSGGGLSGIFVPKTGDSSSIVLWIIVCCAALALMIVLIFFKKRRKKDEDNKEDS